MRQKVLSEQEMAKLGISTAAGILDIRDSDLQEHLRMKVDRNIPLTSTSIRITEVFGYEEEGIIYFGDFERELI
jgi:hypothetical protein